MKKTAQQQLKKKISGMVLQAEWQTKEPELLS